MPILLFPPAGVSATSFNIVFVDQSGVDPVAPGCFVSIYAGSVSPSNLQASGYIGIGGAFSGELDFATTYVAVFSGVQAPTVPATFSTPAQGSGTSLTVTVAQYASPNHSATGYVQDAMALLPLGWFSSTAMAPGGNVYALGAGATSELADQDINAQAARVAARLATSNGADIDSFAQMYFGGALQRQAGESDTAYRARIAATLAAKQGTRSGLQSIGTIYGATVISEPWRPAETGAWDTHGTFAWDSGGGDTPQYGSGVGGWGSQAPLIIVFVTTAPSGAPNTMKSQLLNAKPAGVTTLIADINTITGGIGFGSFL